MIADLEPAIEKACPRLGHVLSTYKDMSVADYAAMLWTPPVDVDSPIVRDARRILSEALAAFLAKHLPPGGVAAALRQFERFPIIQTSDHTQLIIDPVTFHTNLAFRIGAKALGLRFLFVNSCSTVTLETASGRGPGWITIHGTRVNVFGLGRRRLTRTSVCAPVEPVRFEFQTNAPSEKTASTLACLRKVFDDRPFPTAADAFIEANHRLWEFWDADRTRLVYTDDWFVADVVARHLEQEDGIVSRLLFDGRIRSRLDQAFAHASAGAAFPALRDATDYFWSVRRGRIRPMRLADGCLREVAKSGGHSLPFRPEAVRQALLQRQIIPDLRLAFLVIGVLPRTRVLGGSSQLIYVPWIQQAVVTALAALGPQEAAQSSIIGDVQDGWIAGLIEGPDDTGCLLDDGAVLPIAAHAEHWATTPVAESIGRLTISRYLLR